MNDNNRFTKEERLRRAADIKRVFDAQNVIKGKWLIGFALKNELPVTRLGVVVSRKHGIHCRRNRLKRLLREAFRLCKRELPKGLDLILMPRTRSEIPSLTAIISDLRTLFSGKSVW